MYEAMADSHIGKDRKVGWSELSKAQKEVRSPLYRKIRMTSLNKNSAVKNASRTQGNQTNRDTEISLVSPLVSGKQLPSIPFSNPEYDCCNGIFLLSRNVKFTTLTSSRLRAS